MVVVTTQYQFLLASSGRRRQVEVGTVQSERILAAVGGAVGRQGDSRRHGPVDCGLPGHGLPSGAGTVHQPGQQGDRKLYKVTGVLPTCRCWTRSGPLTAADASGESSCTWTSTCIIPSMLQDMSEYGQMDWAYYAVGHQVSLWYSQPPLCPWGGDKTMQTANCRLPTTQVLLPCSHAHWSHCTSASCTAAGDGDEHCSRGHHAAPLHTPAQGVLQDQPQVGADMTH